MVAVYTLIWTGLTVAGRLNVDFAREFPMRAVGMLYFALLPLLMGSLSSAQERHFGMLQSQAMLPVPRAQQWAVKASVVLVLALVLGVVLPWFVFAPPQISRTSFWPLAASIVISDDVEPLHFVVVRKRDYRARVFASCKCGSHGACEVDGFDR